MARDGLLPPVLAKVHPTFGTPYVMTAITGIGVALLAGFVDFATLGDLVSIGTLFAFMLVSVGVLVLRRTRPDLPARLPHPGGVRRLDAVGAAVRLPDAQPDRRDVGALLRLDGRSGWSSTSPTGARHSRLARAERAERRDAAGVTASSRCGGSPITAGARRGFGGRDEGVPGRGPTPLPRQPVRGYLN